MKAKIVFTFVIIIMAFATYAQEFISSRATISSDNDELLSSKNETVLIQLNEETSLFSISSCILLKTAKPDTDSLIILNRPMYLSYQAPFPITDLNFYDAGNEEKTYTMSGELTIGDITKPLKMNFRMHGYSPQNLTENDIHSYPALISFIMEINPDDYRLENVPSCFSNVCFAKIIMLEVNNGTINKSNESGKKPECQASN